MLHITLETIESIKKYIPSHIFWLEHNHIKWDVLFDIVQEECLFYESAAMEDEIDTIYYQFLKEVLTHKDILNDSKLIIASAIEKYLRNKNSKENQTRFEFVTWIKENNIKLNGLENALHYFEEIYCYGKSKKPHTYLITLFNVDPRILNTIKPEKIKDAIVKCITSNTTTPFINDETAVHLLNCIRNHMHSKNTKIIELLNDSSNNFKLSKQTQKQIKPNSKDHDQYILAWFAANDYSLDSVSLIEDEDKGFILEKYISLYHSNKISPKKYRGGQLTMFVRDIEKHILKNPNAWEVFKNELDISDLPGLAKHIKHEQFDDIVNQIKYKNIGVIDWEFISNCPDELKKACLALSNVRSNLLMTIIALDPNIHGDWNGGSISNLKKSKCALALMNVFPEYKDEIQKVFISKAGADALINAVFKDVTGLDNVYTSFKMAWELNVINEKQSYSEDNDIFTSILQFMPKNKTPAIDLDFNPVFD